MFGLGRLFSKRPAPKPVIDLELHRKRQRLIAQRKAKSPRARFCKVDPALQETTIAQLAEVTGRGR